jgi:glutamyl-tRNA reductase
MIAALPSHAASIVLVGCDFRVAPASLRASLVLSAEDRQALIASLRDSAQAAGLVVVNTCNRTEWIVETPHPSWTIELLCAWMQRRFRAVRPDEPTVPRPYAHVGVDAVRHFLRVAAGLESLVPGEREIAGQCSRALAASRAEGLGSQILDQLGHAAGRAVGRIQRLGEFRDVSRGVAGVAVDVVLARIGATGAHPVIGIAGLGEVGRKVAQALEARGARVLSFNRTRRHERCLPLTEIREHLDKMDGLVVATGAPRATIDLTGLIARTPRLVVVDLGVPSQVTLPADADVVDFIGIDNLPIGERAVSDTRALELATQSVELGVEEFHLACERRGSASLLAAVETRRALLRESTLPSLLDEHVADLAPARRRRLEAALSALLRDQQRALVDAIEARVAPSSRSESQP